jgi:hypothetical protein
VTVTALLDAYDRVTTIIARACKVDHVEAWRIFHQEMEADERAILVEAEMLAIEAERQGRIAGSARSAVGEPTLAERERAVEYMLAGPEERARMRLLAEGLAKVQAAREAPLDSPITPHDECVPWNPAVSDQSVADLKRLYQRMLAGVGMSTDGVATHSVEATIPPEPPEPAPPEPPRDGES